MLMWTFQNAKIVKQTVTVLIFLFGSQFVDGQNSSSWKREAWILSQSQFAQIRDRRSQASQRSPKRILKRNLFKSSWGMQEQNGVDVSRAWSINPQIKKNCALDQEIIVAIVDTGFDLNHPDLKHSIWVNKAELNGKKGIDDDKNGFIDDIHGWDFVANSPKIVDHHGHGTHISGIVSANSAINGGFMGVCPGVKIMPLRYFNNYSSGNETLMNTVKAINYDVDNGAKIINYSGGGAQHSQREFKAIKRAREKGVLFVAAAGNEYRSNESQAFYPSSYGLDNIISVASHDKNGKMLRSSNWGRSKVHVAAPGENIRSTSPGGAYALETGTSQATAFVTGLAALIWVQSPKLSYSTVRSIVMNSVIPKKGLKARLKTGGIVNAFLAMRKIFGASKQILKKKTKSAKAKKKKVKRRISSGKKKK